jgi:hypothetical protein
MNLPQSSVDIWLKISMGHGNEKKNQKLGIVALPSPAETELKKRKIDEKSIAVDVKSSGSEESETGSKSECEVDVDIDSWVVWDNFRHASGSDRRVHIALEFGTVRDLNVCTDGE